MRTSLGQTILLAISYATRPLSRRLTGAATKCAPYGQNAEGSRTRTLLFESGKPNS